MVTSGIMTPLCRRKSRVEKVLIPVAVIVVGDHIHDIEAANAGCRKVGGPAATQTQPQRALGGKRPAVVGFASIAAGAFTGINTQTLQDDPIFLHALRYHRLAFQFGLYEDAIGLTQEIEQRRTEVGCPGAIIAPGLAIFINERLETSTRLLGITIWVRQS